MNTYEVVETLTVIEFRRYDVEADSEAEALRKVRSGEVADKGEIIGQDVMSSSVALF